MTRIGAHLGYWHIYTDVHCYGMHAHFLEDVLSSPVYPSSALQSVVETQIYPNVATGFSDSNAYLRELTLKSMLVLAPKLSQKTLTQSLLKFLAKLQVSPTLYTA